MFGLMTDFVFVLPHLKFIVIVPNSLALFWTVSELRLQGTRRTRQDMGVVEVSIRSEWQAACVSNNKMAKVVCRQLGLPTWDVLLF